MIAVSNLDEVVEMIRGASNPADAREKLLAREWPIGDIAQYIALVEAIEPNLDQNGGTYRLSEIQVQAILDLRLHRLTALGRDEIGDELGELAVKIAEYLAILGDRRTALRRDARRAGRDPRALRHAARRRDRPAWDGIEDEDLIEREDMVVTVTLDGYIKRTTLSTFRAQNRGGKGRAGMSTKDEDAVSAMFVTSTHNPVLFFSTAGKVYRLKVWRLPEGGPATRGRPIVNMLPGARRRARRSPPCCRCPRTRTAGARSAWSSPPPRAACGAIRWMRSPTSPRTASSRCASRKAARTG